MRTQIYYVTNEKEQSQYINMFKAGTDMDADHHASQH